jgi:hypothetical protein
VVSSRCCTTSWSHCCVVWTVSLRRCVVRSPCCSCGDSPLNGRAAMLHLHYIAPPLCGSATVLSLRRVVSPLRHSPTVLPRRIVFAVVLQLRCFTAPRYLYRYVAPRSCCCAELSSSLCCKHSVLQPHGVAGPLMCCCAVSLGDRVTARPCCSPVAL